MRVRIAAGPRLAAPDAAATTVAQRACATMSRRAARVVRQRPAGRRQPLRWNDSAVCLTTTTASGFDPSQPGGAQIGAITEIIAICAEGGRFRRSVSPGPRRPQRLEKARYCSKTRRLAALCRKRLDASAGLAHEKSAKYRYDAGRGGAPTSPNRRPKRQCLVLLNWAFAVQARAAVARSWCS